MYTLRTQCFAVVFFLFLLMIRDAVVDINADDYALWYSVVCVVVTSAAFAVFIVGGGRNDNY